MVRLACRRLLGRCRLPLGHAPEKFLRVFAAQPLARQIVQEEGLGVFATAFKRISGTAHGLSVTFREGIVDGVG
jgi:hypothetical protein